MSAETTVRRAPARDAAPAVFAEPSGRRWRRFQLICLLLLAALAGLTWTQLAPVAGLLVPPAGPSAEAVNSRLGHDPVVIGSGPMLRVVDLRDGHAVDPFRGTDLGELDAAAVAAAAGRGTVLQRYGYDTAGGRRLVLTFDDGPDPIWTPKVLDVLAEHDAHATFFVTGRAAAAHPELVRRIVREGHVLANHSMSHRDLSGVPGWLGRLELAGNEQLLTGISGQTVRLVRPPYDGGLSGALGAESLAIARAQRLGSAVASYDFDTHDWMYGGGSGDSARALALPAQIALPPLDGRSTTVLMHDAGGDRARTVAYLDQRLLPAAAAAGYTVSTVPQASRGLDGDTGVARTRHPAAERAVQQLAEAWLVLPNRLFRYLFALALVAMAGMGGGYAVLAVVRRRRRPAPPARRSDDPRPPLSVSVLIAAYNEATVIEATLRTLVVSSYPVAEFVVVDDGSTDGTGDIVERLSHTLDPRIRVIRQPNGKKPAALNHGFGDLRSEIVVTVDADTHAHPDLVAHLVRHFEADPYGTLGAVAGVVRVGNRGSNLLTRWQALEYLNQIGLERAAHDLLGAIAIVPGACAGWRREAVLRAGGFSHATLAEDCDLTLALHRAGWRVTQDDESLADTEAPQDVDSLLKQRVRWTYGTLQAIAKHRDMVLRARFGWLGLLVLPWTVVSLVLPLLTIPFITVMSTLMFVSQGPAMLGRYYLLFTAAQVVTSGVAVRLMRERLRLLVMVPAYRLVYEPLRAYLLYRCTYLAVRGVPVGWNKLVRTGALNR